MESRLPVERRFEQYLLGFCGVFVFGILLPSVLVWLHGKGRENFFNEPFSPNRLTVSDLIDTLIYATMFVGPGAVVISLITLTRLGNNVSAEFDIRAAVRSGGKTGAMISFFNLPAFGLVALLHGPIIQVSVAIIILFSVAGYFSGAWIAWCHYRMLNSTEPFNFSLGTLLATCLGWSALATLFFLS